MSDIHSRLIPRVSRLAFFFSYTSIVFHDFHFSKLKDTC